MRFRTVLFDLDGTLIEHLPAIHRCYAHTLPKLGYAAPTYEEVKRAIGGGLPRAMARFVPQERVEEALAIYRPHWDATMLEGVELMPGARALLVALREMGVRSAVFTNKHGPSARRVCEHLGLSDLLDGVFGAGDTEWLKPDIGFAEYVFAQLNEIPANCCLVGDSPYDVDAAKAVDMAFYGVTTGTHNAAQLAEAGAAYVDDGFAELAARWSLSRVVNNL